MRVSKPEKPIMDSPESPDYYQELGCCIGCDEQRKEIQISGLQRSVWYKSKFYSCLCDDCKCYDCTWLYDGECQRKYYVYGLAT